MVVFPTHRRQLLTLAAGTGMVGLLGFLSGRRHLTGLRRAWNLMGCGCFAFHAGRLAGLAMRPAALVLGREGILDCAGAPPAGFLPWDLLAPAEAVVLPLGPILRKYVGLRLRGVPGATGVAGEGGEAVLGRRRSAFEPPHFSTFAALIPEYVLLDRVEVVVQTVNDYLDDPEEREELGSLAGSPAKALW